ncbi:MAG: NADH-quinone oxidoreductase subunit G [Propionibacteriaceae bacterium]|nr:NADH-quinone oxidoreductase subunit G [Propionibacteriaceae bacterium]
MVTITIDGTQVTIPKGTMALRAAEAAGIAIPRFCDHPLLDPAGSCRQCMVDIVDAGNGRGFPKPQPSCATEAMNGMILATQNTSEAAAKAQADVLELLLINHPLDCPICDKGGECPLQNQALAQGRSETRYDGVKRSYPKPIALSELILLDRERCVLCARCTRFSDQIAGDPMISLVERGIKQQVGIYPEQPFDSYFSGNVVQICPVGALTSSDYRFSARPFDLVSTVTTCENCAAGCQLRVDARRFEVRRRYAGENPEINEEWSCDRGRFGFVSARGEDRITKPMIRLNGEWVKVSWPEALDAAVAGLKAAEASTGVLLSGRLTLETSYAYSKFARTVLQTNSIDFRTRASSTEEAQFLAAMVASASTTVTYEDLERAKKVILVYLEPEDESPAVFLRLRKATRKKGLTVDVVSTFLTRGSAKLNANLIPTRPYDAPQAIANLQADEDTIILVGERLAQIPGGFTALAAKVNSSGAKMAWIPRRAGEVGAVETGCLPGLLPNAHPAKDADAAARINEAWGCELPTTPGLEFPAQIEAAAQGKLKALVVSGIEADDFPDPDAVRSALRTAFVVSLESRMSEAANLANVILPVDLLEETEGSFLNWEHRLCPVNQVIGSNRSAMDEIRVLAALAQAMGQPLGFRTPEGAWESFAQLPDWDGQPSAMTPVTPSTDDAKGVVVSTWRELIDDSRCLDGAEPLHSTSRSIVARISPATLRTEGLATSTFVRLTGPKGSATFPLQVDPTMVEGVIWAPARSRNKALSAIGVGVGVEVTLAAAPDPKKEGEE